MASGVLQMMLRILVLVILCLLQYTECLPESIDKIGVTISDGFNRKNCTSQKLDDISWKQCGDRGYTMNCGGLNLQTVPHKYPKMNSSLTPPLCLLNLSHNALTTIRNNSFVGAINMNSSDVLWLYLQNNDISYIDSNAFMNLTSLLFLNLSGNHLTWPDGFGIGTFRQLTSLKYLNMHDNNITTFEGLGREMQYMKQLEGFFLELCQDCKFGIGFGNLTNLVNLSLSTIVSRHPCFAPVLHNDTFKYVPRIKNLFVGMCQVKTIEANAFAPLKNLVKLDISYNKHLHFDGMNTALYGLRYSKTLMILNVNHIHPLYGLGNKLSNENMQNIQTLQALEVLHMDLNKIEVLDETVPLVGFPKTLKNLTLTGNRLTHGKYVSHITNMTIINIDISRQYLGYDPFYSEHFGTNWVSKLSTTNDSTTSSTSPLIKCDCEMFGVFCLPKNIQTFLWRKSFVYYRSQDTPGDIYICGAEHLKHLDLSFNLITTWNLVPHGIDNVTDLDLSMNDCDEIEPRFFHYFGSLKRLNISLNRIGDAFYKLDPSKHPLVFKNNTDLEIIDISSNKLTNLHHDMFKDLSNLKRIHLGYNLLTAWNTSLEKSRCLEMLCLMNNQLNVLEKATTDYLESLTKEPCYKNITVDLSGNPLDCACSHLPFLKWIRDTEVLVKMSLASDCSVNGKRYPLRNLADIAFIIGILEGDACNFETKTWITWVASIASVVGTGFISAATCTLVYKNRWKLRYLYYSRHRRHVLEGYDRLFQYDAIICYSKSMGSFLKHSVIPMLEEVHELVTWAYDKNFVPGASIAENITHAINNSKKAVLLLNREFLQDSWCDYETNMAHVESIVTKRQMIIIVMMESIDMDELPLHYRRLLMAERSMEFPEHGQDEETFWMNLADEIRA